jgi:uncharacterized membrane protein
LPQRSAASNRSRIPALDAARAFGVVAMVVGHTLDALLAPAARQAPLLVSYWKARGLTAPLFFMAAGWAVTVAIRRSGGEGLAVVRARLPRVLLLLVVGYALRWPGWGIDLLRAGHVGTWAHLLAFDALHAIAIALLAAALVLGVSWSVREKALTFALLGVLAVGLGLSAPAPFPLDPAQLPSTPLAIAFAQAAGGTSTFPLFPWTAYFFAGALVGLLGPAGAGRRAAALAAAGGALVLGTAWAGVGTMPPGHPILFAFRAGAVLLLFAALSAVPARAAAWAAPLGRASLGVYAIHVAVVYGWSTHEGLSVRIGPTLEVGPALAIAALVLAASVAATVAVRVAVSAGAAALAAAARVVVPAPVRAVVRPAVLAIAPRFDRSGR